jgi:hypothetical protein
MPALFLSSQTDGSGGSHFIAGPVQTCGFRGIIVLPFGLALPPAVTNNKGRKSGESGQAGSTRLAKGFLSTALKVVRLF